jgi:CHAT domain-containing protein
MAQARAFEKEMRKHEYKDPKAAIAAGEKWLALLREVNADLDHAHWMLAWLYGKVDQPGKRLEHLRARVRVRESKFGKDHWEVTDARLEADAEARKQRLTDAERKREQAAWRLIYKMRDLRRKSQLAAAAAVAREALPVCREAFPPNSPDLADVLSDMANAHQSAGEFSRAEPLFQQTLTIRRKVLGERHPLYVGTLNNIGLLYQRQGAYSQAERYYRQAFDLMLPLRREVPAGTGWHRLKGQFATIVNNRALLYHATGQYDRAEPMYREALAAYADAVGRAHYEYATCLDNLGSLYHAMGDHASAERRLQEALKVRRFLLEYEFLVSMAGGNVHRDLALTLNNLGMLYRDAGQIDRALPMLRQAMEIRKKQVGESHADYALAANNLAAVLGAKGDHKEALRLQQIAVDVWKRTLGEKHVLYANGLHNLAGRYRAKGDFEKARSLYKKAHAVYREAVGETHPNLARSLGDLARLSWQAGEREHAWRQARKATELTRRHVEQTAAAQSERQQLAMNRTLRPALDQELALAVETDQPAEEIYPEVLAWKGAVSARQQYTRRLRQAIAADKDPKVSRLFDELSRASRELATLTGAVAAGVRISDRERRMRELSDRIEDAEKALARASADFRGILASRRATPADLQKALPADTVLVDLLEYEHDRPPAKAGAKWTWEKRVAAFIIRPAKPIVRIDLGSAQRITRLIEEWRRHFTPGLRVPGAGNAIASELRKLLWPPLESHLKGARTVLISPDGATARLPWAALPGSRPGTWLLEEVALAVVPVPQLLLEKRDQTDAGEASLLLVGDVDYDARGSKGDDGMRSAARTGEKLEWTRLENTRAEIKAVRSAFRSRFPSGKVLSLEGNKPTEEAIRKQAQRQRYLHFATHGYFAPAKVPSALSTARGDDSPVLSGEVTGFHPGLLSGLVLAGANRPPALDRDDGILTALEVADLDLSRTELAVLSACETGLGEAAGGEGLLGLQRAFQTAGARSVVSSLWKVPDRATQALMTRFYANLWSKKMTRLEALRQAQLWMLREGAKEEALRGVFNPKTGTGKKPPEKARPTDEKGRALPHYWAAFVLSGEWR